MILTALVQTKGGTLVVDLPRDRIDLEMKIRSVGIERLSDQIRIIDDEEKSMKKPGTDSRVSSRLCNGQYSI